MTTSIITRGSGVSIAGRQSRGLSPAFSRASAAYQSDGRKVGVGVPRFEVVDGRRGVLLEEWTTNLVTSPDDGTLTGEIPGCSGKHHSFATGYWVKDWSIPSAAATDKTFTYSIWMRSTTSPASTALLYLYDGTGSDGGWWSFGGFNLTPEWKRYTYTRSGMTGTITKIRVYRSNQQGTLDIACPQLEAKPYATSFVDGTRAAEQLSLPTADMLGLREGTYEAWLEPKPAFWHYSWNRIIGHSTSMNRNEIELMRNSDSSGLAFAISNSAGGTLGWNKVCTKTSLKVGTWYHVAADIITRPGKLEVIRR